MTRMGHSPFQQQPSGVHLRKIIYAVLCQAQKQGYIEGIQCSVKVQYHLDDILVSIIKTNPKWHLKKPYSKEGL